MALRRIFFYTLAVGGANGILKGLSFFFAVMLSQKERIADFARRCGKEHWSALRSRESMDFLLSIILFLIVAVGFMR